MIEFVSDLWHVSGFLRFPLPIKLTPTIYNWNIVESDIKHHETNQPTNHCNQCLLPLKFVTWITLWVLQGLVAGFFPCILISSNNNTDCHYLTKIFLKVALNTKHAFINANFLKFCQSQLDLSSDMWRNAYCLQTKSHYSMTAKVKIIKMKGSMFSSIQRLHKNFVKYRKTCVIILKDR